MKRFLRCLAVTGLALAAPVLTEAIPVDPVPPPDCSAICWNVSNLHAACRNGQITTTCWHYLN